MIALSVSFFLTAQGQSDDAVTWSSQAVITLKADGSGDYSTLEEAVKQAPSGATINLGAGSYRLKSNLKIYKSLKLVGEGMDRTEIVSRAEEYVVYFTGEGPFRAEKITFRHEGDQPADVVNVLGGKVSFIDCRFIGATGDDNDYSWGMGLRLEKDTTGIIRGCEAVDNAYNGIYLTDRSRPLLEGNIASGNGWSGITYYDNATGVASQNQSVGNKNSGIYVGADAHPTLEGNVCVYNDGSGINYYDQSFGTARGNQSAWNGYHGISIADSAKPTLEDNLLANNADSGIAYFDSSSGVSRLNTCSNNAWYGIYAGEKALPHLEKNTCAGNQTGIYFDGEAGGIAYQNECMNNETGIFVAESADPELVENQSYDNTGENLYDQRLLLPQEEERPAEERFIFKENFADPSSGWASLENENIQKGYENGEYSILIKKANYSHWTLFPTAKIPAAFSLAVKARKLGDSEGEYGIIFGFIDQQNYYLFSIDSKGHYKLERIVNGKAATRIDWRYSYAINKGNKTNALKLVVDTANNLKLYANGVLIRTVLTESYYEGGHLAVCAQSYDPNFQVKFDDIELTGI